MRIQIDFITTKNLAIYTEIYPTTVLAGLIKIGGLIAIFRIGTLLQLFNRRVFHSHLRDHLQTTPTTPVDRNGHDTSK